MRPFVPVTLLDQSGTKIAASLYEGVSPHNLKHFRDDWLPVIRKHYAEDADWDWEKKIKDKLLVLREFALECAGSTEGLMQINLQHISRIDGKHVAYVEYIHAAPWNRRELQTPPRYRPVGHTLILHALQVSAEEGFSGRIALHSLPGAISWYRDKIGMTDFGPDHTKLHYFELDSEQSRRLLQNSGGPIK